METLSNSQYAALDAIMALRNGITAITLMRKLQSGYDLNINWHILSAFLDSLRQIGLLAVTGQDNTGMTVYKVKGK